MSHYYSFKSEYQAIFADESNLQISTVQWDTKNGERFNIKYMNEQGKKVPISTIIHASSFGSIERSIAAILETALWEEKSGLNPVVHTIAPFITERAYEQIKLDFGYQKQNINLISVGGSFDYSKLGCSHHCYTDVSLFSHFL